MKRSGFLLFIIFISVQVIAQKTEFVKPDYPTIRKQVFDNTSEYFYPKLYNRYMAGDTSLNLEHFRHLYYGYTFQSQYIPYQESKYQDKMLVYLKKGTLNTKELNEFIKLAELNLKDLPFDIRTLNILSYSYTQKNDMIQSRIAAFKKASIIKAIFSSGDGLSEQTAFHVIDTSHEFDIINEFGFKYGGASDLSNALCDYLIVQQNEKNIRGYYFDISRLLHVKAERNN
jgi:hypothetical protein